MKNEKWLKAAYWAGAIADFIMSGLVLIPGIYGMENYVAPMGLLSVVAFSWAIMLILATRKPLERRWVLIPTLLVVFLLQVVIISNAIIFGTSAVILIPNIVTGVVVFTVSLIAYLKTKNIFSC